MGNLINRTVSTQQLWVHNEEYTSVTVLPENTLNIRNLEAIRPRPFHVSRANEKGVGGIVSMSVWSVTKTGR